MEITWGDKTITCEEGTTLFDISKQVEKEYEIDYCRKSGWCDSGIIP